MPDTFRKARAGAPAGLFRCESAGLAWLRDARGARVVDVLDVGDDHLGLVRLSPTRPAPRAPAAHGGHRETDLAMLALFGLPFLDETPAGYQQVHALRPGRRHRAGLHQLDPVGVHALLSGAGYAGQAARLVAPWV